MTIDIAGTGGLRTAPSSSLEANKARGICSLQTASGKSFRFRTNPNSIKWKYVLNTNIEDTYGGRVIQILSAQITQLQVQVEAGWGGWPYVVKLAYFMRDLMNEQRNGKPAEFKYTTRNWKLKVFAASIPFTDTVGKPNTKIDMTFNVVEDSSGQLSSTTIGAELSRLQEGIGYKRNKFNHYDDSAIANSPLSMAQDLLELGQNFLQDGPAGLFGIGTSPTSPAGGTLGSVVPGLGGFL